MSGLLDLALDAHGGIDRWRALTEIDVRARSGGLALGMKGHTRRFDPFRARVRVQEPRTVIESFPEPGMRGVFEPSLVRIEREAGETVEERPEPRSAFPGLRRQVRWDHLDILYFVGYAIWNYVTTPYMFTFPGVSSEETGDYRGLRMLRVTFPDSIPTHCPVQTFYFTGEGELARFDYTAQVIGGWARAVHACSRYEEAGGIRLAATRKVTPRAYLTRVALPGPTLVWIEMDEIRPA